MPMQMQKAQKIKQMIPLSNGIFGHMTYTFRAEVTKNSLDMMFLANYGNRNPSPIVEMLQDDYGEPLDSTALTQLATVIEEMYSEKWDKLAEIYDIEYDPIHNYLDQWEDESDETEEIDRSNSGSSTTTYGKTESGTQLRTDNLSEARTIAEDSTIERTDDLTKTQTLNTEKSTTRTDNLQEETTYGKTNTRTDNLMNTHSDSNSIIDAGTANENVFGFNSSTATPASSSGSGNTRTETLGGTIANTGTQSDALSGKDTIKDTGTRTDVTDDTGTVTTTDDGTQTTTTEKDITDTTLNTGTRTTTNSVTHGGSDGTTTSGTSSEDTTRGRERSGRHFGNIGNLTSQKQILEEINLWKWNYMQEILNDVKEFCTLPVYLNATEWRLVDQQD